MNGTNTFDKSNCAIAAEEASPPGLATEETTPPPRLQLPYFFRSNLFYRIRSSVAQRTNVNNHCTFFFALRGTNTVHFGLLNSCLLVYFSCGYGVLHVQIIAIIAGVLSRGGRVVGCSENLAHP